MGVVTISGRFATARYLDGREKKTHVNLFTHSQRFARYALDRYRGYLYSRERNELKKVAKNWAISKGLPPKQADWATSY